MQYPIYSSDISHVSQAHRSQPRVHCTTTPLLSCMAYCPQQLPACAAQGHKSLALLSIPHAPVLLPMPLCTPAHTPCPCATAHTQWPLPCVPPPAEPAADRTSPPAPHFLPPWLAPLPRPARMHSTRLRKGMVGGIVVGRAWQGSSNVAGQGIMGVRSPACRHAF